MKLKNFLILSFIFIVSFFVRFYGINWDQSQHLHPDERYLSMVINDIKMPSNIIEYLDTKNSVLNPYNYSDYKFFVYGTFPVFFTKYIAGVFSLDNYDTVAFVGRIIVVLIDSLNVVLLYFLAKLVFKKNNKLCFISSLFYCFLVLPIQLCHFFTVDPFLNFFLLLSFVLLCYSSSNFWLSFFSSVAFGLSVASKITAVLFVPIIFLFFVLNKKNNQKIIVKLSFCAVYFLISFFAFRLAQPYSFIGFIHPNPDFINSLKELSVYSKPDGFYPPSVVWISKQKIVFPLQNIALWGIGLPIFNLSIFAFVFLLFKTKIGFFKKIFSEKIIFLSFLWIVGLFFYVSTRFTYNLRYFLPIYPFICLFTVWLVSELKIYKILKIVFILNLVYCFAFLNIYRLPNTRIAASNWIYSHLPSGSTITAEYWDDALPLSFSDRQNTFNTEWLKLYDPESDQKWSEINGQLNSANYLVISSNRLWASIPKVPSLYPQTTKFYQDLFEGKTMFSKYKEVNSYPGFSLSFLKKCLYFGYTDYPYKNLPNKFFETGECDNPGIYLRDDTAEESFTVYDHPKVLIFSKKVSYSQQ